PHRVFARALGSTEASFYWDGEFCGTADCIDRTTVRLAPALYIADPVADAKRFRAVWMRLKQRFPLLAARVDEIDGGEKLRFVVSEARMQDALLPGEFEYVPDADARASEHAVERYLNAPARHLSRTLPAALTVLRCADGLEGTYEIVSAFAHMITDGMAGFTFSRALCDILAQGPAALGAPLPDLQQGLALVPSSESLHPTRRLPLARQRWRRAVARIINTRRAVELIGGQTLPRTFTTLTPHTPARSCALRASLSPEVSKAAVAACRVHGVTVGNALPVLGQVALSRVLHRRLARGELSLEEWARRTRGPTLTGGPLNLRPFLAPEWVAAGGMDVVNICIGFFFEILPSLPRAPLRDPADPVSFALDTSGAPSFANLLPQPRFWLRAAMGKRTAARYHHHALFLELAADIADTRVARARSTASVWKKICSGEGANVPPLEKDTRVVTHGGSSMGKVSVHLLFPLSRTPAEPPVEPTLVRAASKGYLRCRPGELYLGLNMANSTLNFTIFYDANAYADEVVQEWLDEVRGATIYFLGGG
ncbi:hypothetical protein K488DRAFT_22700, partial [Vararia minispora EC-137]